MVFSETYLAVYLVDHIPTCIIYVGQILDLHSGEFRIFGTKSRHLIRLQLPHTRFVLLYKSENATRTTNTVDSALSGHRLIGFSAYVGQIGRNRSVSTYINKSQLPSICLSISLFVCIAVCPLLR